MSRHQPNPRPNHRHNYEQNPHAPRNKRNEVVRSDPERHLSKNFSRPDPFDEFDELRPHAHGHRPRLPLPNVEGRMSEHHFYTTAQIDAMEAENSRQPRRPAEGFEPFARRRKKPVKIRELIYYLLTLCSSGPACMDSSQRRLSSTTRIRTWAT